MSIMVACGINNDENFGLSLQIALLLYDDVFFIYIIDRRLYRLIHLTILFLKIKLIMFNCNGNKYILIPEL